MAVVLRRPGSLLARRLSLAAGALTLLVGVAVVVIRERGVHARDQPAYEFFDSSALVPDWLRVAAAPHLDVDRSGHLPELPPELWILGPGRAPKLGPDPLAYFTRRPFSSARWAWAEHPDAGFERNVGALGLRQAAPLPDERPDPLIVLTGDSHIDGVCADDETASHRLELLLHSSGQPGATVLNAACGSYTLQNYLGVAKRFAHVEPDVLIVTVFGGNDFGELLPFEQQLRRRGPLPRPDGYLDALREAELLEVDGRRGGSSLWQGLNQAYSFSRSPELVETTLELSLSVFEELQRSMDESGTELIVCHLPPVHEVQRAHVHPAFEAVRVALVLDEVDLARQRDLADRFLAGLEERGIATLDVRAAFSGADVDLYWRRDEHLNVAGQQLLAELLEPVVQEALVDG